jgi:putative ABC transport system permease protein
MPDRLSDPIPDDLSGLSGWCARRLPSHVRERCFRPTYYELLSTHVLESSDVPLRHRAAGALAFRAGVATALVQCAFLAIADARRRRSVQPSQPILSGVAPMLVQDLRFAFRMLWKHPGFTAVATIALALGIGASTAIFSVVQAVLLRPLPYNGPERIFELSETARGGLMTLSPPNLLDWKAQNTTFSAIAAYNDTSVTLSGDFEPEQLDAALVGVEIFEVLGVAPARGRRFVPDEARPGGPRAVILGHGPWQQRFGGDEGIIGRTLTFDGRPFQVVGVMPRGFTFPGEMDLWFPLRLTDDELTPNQRGAHYLNAVGRLKPGVTIAQAIDDLARIEQRIADQHASVQGYGVWAQPLLDSMVGNVRKPLLILFGAVGFVLLIACANVSNLLLARASARRTEIAVRSALGAGRWQIVRQLLAESVLLALAGGLCGLLLAAWGVRTLNGVLPQNLPRAGGIDLNASILVFSVIVSMATGVVFGIVPSMYASSADLVSFLKDARRDGSSGSSRRTFRNALVAIEVALALVLLTGAGLAIRSFDRLTAIDPGFDPSGVLAVSLTLSGYPDAAATARFYEQYVESLRSQPGVAAAGGVMRPPLASGGFGGTFTIVGAEDAEDQSMQVRAATAGYMEALRIPLRRGRLLTTADGGNGQPVAILSEEASRRFFPGRDPVGQRIRLHVGITGTDPVREIVGVVGNVKLRRIDSAPAAVAYVPHSQYVSDDMTIFVRGKSDPMALVPMVKSQLASIDREVALTRVLPAERLVAASVAEPRFRMILLGLFAAIALALAAVGLYGVMAFAVSQRQAEIGVRMALGADRTTVLRLVLAQGMLPVAIGMAVGLAAAAALTKLMSGLLYEVSPLDPVTYAAVALVLSVVAATACYIPARRATRVDPLAALRAE